VSEEFVTIDEIAERLHVTTETVRVWIREKQLTAYKIGRSYLVKPEDLEKFIESRKTNKDE